MMIRIFLDERECELIDLRYGQNNFVHEVCRKMFISHSEFYRMLDEVFNKIIFAISCGEKHTQLNDIKVMLEAYIHENENLRDS